MKYSIIGLISLCGAIHTASAQFELAGWDFSNLAPFGPGASWETTPANYGLLKDGAKVVTSAFEQLDSVAGSNLGTFQVTTNDGTTVGTSGTAFSTETNDPAAIAIFNAGVNGKGIVIEFSTKGYQQIKIKYAARAGSTAPKSNQWQWSVDGTNYNNVGAINSVSVDFYSPYEYDLASIAEVNNKDKVYLRYLVDGSTGTGATPETALALDNIQILAAAEAGGNPVLGFFPTATDQGGGNYTSPWLGSFNATSFPWILHNEHGYLYCTGTSDSIWFYDLSLQGWMYTTPSVYPWLWSAQTVGDITADWHYYFVGTKSPRYFVRLPQGGDPVFIAVQ